MELLESWLGALAMLTEPFWLTLEALGGMIVAAGAGTAILGSFLLLLSLDFLRASKGLFIHVARTAAVASSFFIVASFVYGDFMAGPARAAYTAIVARSPAVPSSVVALTTLSAAGASLIFYAGRNTAPRGLALPPQRPGAHALISVRRESGALRIAEFGRALSLDPAGRLQLRQMSRNPKKSAHVVRPAMRSMAAGVHAAGTHGAGMGRRIAHG